MEKLVSFYNCQKFVLFGAGDSRVPVERFLAQLGKDIIAYVDNRHQDYPVTLNGRPVLSPSKIKSLLGTNVGVLISSSAQYEISWQLVNELDIAEPRIFPYITEMFVESFGNDAFQKNKCELNSLMDLLSDVESKNYIRSLVEYRRALNPLKLRPNPKLIDFYEYRTPKPLYFDGMKIVDIGAYTGDTARYFLKKSAISRIYAFEGLSSNFNHLREWVLSSGNSDIVTPFKKFLGSRVGEVLVHSEVDGEDPRATSASRSGGHKVDTVQMTTLDECFFSGVDQSKVDLVKIDVEGADLEVLEGGEKFLKHQRPMLMVAGYHANNHIVEIPKFIKKTLPTAGIYAGHHNKCIFEIEFYVQ